MNKTSFASVGLLVLQFSLLSGLNAQTKTPPTGATSLRGKTPYQAASSAAAVVPAVPSTKLNVPKPNPTFTNSSSSETVSDLGTVSPTELKKEALEDQIKLLEEMVNVSSDTKIDIDGVNKVQSIVERELKELNFKVEMIANPDPYSKVGNLLVATLPGKSEQAITLVAHADTVFPSTLSFTKFKRDSETEASGPGVIDDKGGLVVGIEALKMYLEENPTPPYTLRFLVSPSEEIGSGGFLEYFQLSSLTSKAVFGLEPALDLGDIVDSRRGDRWYDVTVKGREAHAGRAHEQGVNACHELAIKIEKLQKLTNYKKEVSVSVGSIKGGKDKFAIVCGEASMKLDVRFADLKNRARILKSVEDILKGQCVKAKSDGARAVTEWKVVDDPQPFPTDIAAKNLIETYKKVISDLEGNKIISKRSGGTSDANFFYRSGLVLIDGLGPIGSGMHTVEEKIQLKTLQTRAKALSKLIQAAGF